MKVTILLLILFVFNWSAKCEQHWKKRMQKYCALANCQYYATSECRYTDYISINEVAKSANNNNTFQIRFFALTKDGILLKLSENDSNDLKSEHDTDHHYEFAFGSESHRIWENSDILIRSLHAPGAVKTDEPNEVLIEIDSDGRIRATINEDITLTMRADIEKLKYISVRSSKDDALQEFFYNCDLN
ncbi:uncharacterized protein LOC129567092 [Sitodiplosis mosellana]|uniref:uncharacterized protein LOC129567092 n=1 Tax=Sitodiplosis mosellana TaxID=263140 RepID=UPI0024445D67|nr:uncharacterized protein LOC129567092 [Sitodiplosis mosellana]